MIPIITAEERLSAPPKINMAIVGPSGVGKTTLAKTLPPDSTLFVDLEAGTLAIEGWNGNILKVRTWEYARDLVCLLHGPDLSRRPEQYYSQNHYDQALVSYGPETIEQLAPYKIFFFDSITVAARLCFNWALGQPDAYNDKGKKDTRGAYGLLGREMVDWLTHIQHIEGRSVIVVSILDNKKNDMGMPTFEMQIEGQKASRELPGIFDLVMTMNYFTTPEGLRFRGLCCHDMNPWGYPAKDRSGRLDLIEEPDLTKLMTKIRDGLRNDAMQTAMPAAVDQGAAIGQEFLAHQIQEAPLTT